MKLRKETLSNGMTLLNVPSKGDTGAVLLIVRAGSRDETRETAGLAHVLEHMFFMGTTTPGRERAALVQRQFQKIGASSNAFTDIEEVGYHAAGPVERIPEMVELIADMVTHTKITQENLDTERDVVIQELAASLIDPTGWTEEKLQRAIFGKEQSLGWTASGEISVVKQATKKQLNDYRKKFYSPNQMALVVVGRGIAKEQVEEFFKDLPKSVTRPPRKKTVWGVGKEAVVDIRKGTGTDHQAQLMIGLPGVASRDKSLPVASVFAAVLQDRLFNQARNAEGLCYTMEVEHFPLEDLGITYIVTGTAPKDMVRMGEIVNWEIKNLATRVASEEELMSIKEDLVGKLLRESETAEAKAEFYGKRWRAQKPIISPKEVADLIRKVTREEVKAFARKSYQELPKARIAMVSSRDNGQKVLGALRGRTRKAVAREL